MNNWVIIADNTEAKVYSAQKERKELTQVTNIKNLKARMKEGDLTSDRPGQTLNSAAGKNMRSVGQENKAVDNAFNQYLHSISKFMKTKKNQNSYDSIVVVAGPGVLGPLVSELERNKLRVSQTIRKQYTHMKEDELAKQLRDDILPTFKLA